MLTQHRGRYRKPNRRIKMNHPSQKQPSRAAGGPPSPEFWILTSGFSPNEPNLIPTTSPPRWPKVSPDAHRETQSTPQPPGPRPIYAKRTQFTPSQPKYPQRTQFHVPPPLRRPNHPPLRKTNPIYPTPRHPARFPMPKTAKRTQSDTHTARPKTKKN